MLIYPGLWRLLIPSIQVLEVVFVPRPSRVLEAFWNVSGKLLSSPAWPMCLTDLIGDIGLTNETQAASCAICPLRGGHNKFTGAREFPPVRSISDNTFYFFIYSMWSLSLTSRCLPLTVTGAQNRFRRFFERSNGAKRWEKSKTKLLTKCLNKYFWKSSIKLL
jgi:hypothetical protein